MTKQQKEQIQWLVLQYMTEQASAAEIGQLSLLLTENKDDAAWQDIMEELFSTEAAMENYQEAEWQPMIEELIRQNRKQAIRHIPIWRRWAVAASIMLAIGLGAYFLFFNKAAKQTEIVKTQEERFKNDVPPGSDKAILVLADGREITLEANGTQTLIDKNGAEIKNDNGAISYSNAKSKEVVYNTLKIPRKGEYKLLLDDGSIVKLNSESSVYYPTAFTGSQRKVEITGEAYFEIAKDATKPFIVSVKGTEIKVLGTHFNVNAYDNETTIRTTLIEGSVEVSKNGKSMKITPGQQARINNNGEISVTNDVNTNEIIAWTTGYFNFNNAGIETIMRQVERWYDVDVVYESKPTQEFIAEIPRTVNASDFFRILEATGWVHFKIEGRTVTVMK